MTEGVRRRWVLSGAATIVAIAFSSPAVAGGPNLRDYKAADAGTLIFSVSAHEGFNMPTVDFYFYRVDREGSFYMRVTGARWPPSALILTRQRPKDFVETLDNPPAARFDAPGVTYEAGAYEGAVMIHRLPPGRYELRRIVGYYPVGGASHTYGDLGIPFEIRPGRATYIGEFKPLNVLQKSFAGNSTLRGWRIVVSDQSARDVPIARQKDTSITDYDAQVTDLGTLHRSDIGSQP